MVGFTSYDNNLNRTVHDEEVSDWLRKLAWIKRKISERKDLVNLLIENNIDIEMLSTRQREALSSAFELNREMVLNLKYTQKEKDELEKKKFFNKISNKEPKDKREKALDRLNSKMDWKK